MNNKPVVILLVCVVIIGLFAGCGPSNQETSQNELTEKELTQKKLAVKEFSDIVQIFSFSVFYYQENEKFPDSVQQLKEYVCQKSPIAEFIDWDNYSIEFIAEDKINITDLRSGIVVPLNPTKMTDEEMQNTALYKEINKLIEKELSQ